MILCPRACRMALAAAIAAAPTAAAAGAAPGRTIELVPLLGLRGGASMDADVPGRPPAEADAAPSFGLGVEVSVRPDGWLEAFVDRQTLRFDADPATFGAGAFDVTIDYLQVGGGYEPGGGRVRPFVAAALGLTHFAASAASVSDSTGFSGSLAGGVKVPVGKAVVLRFELRGYGTSGSTAVSASYGPGFTLAYATSGWYQLALRAGIGIRL